LAADVDADIIEHIDPDMSFPYADTGYGITCQERPIDCIEAIMHGLFFDFAARANTLCAL
jgi:hypothetical protein